MIKFITVFILLFLMIENCYSQFYINRRKKKVLKMLNEYQVKQKYKSIIKETDSTVSFYIRDSSLYNLDITYHFNKSDRCDAVLNVSACDTCFKMYLQETLNTSFIKWFKLTETLYITRPWQRIVMEIISDTTSKKKYFGYLLRKETKENILKYRNEYKKSIK